MDLQFIGRGRPILIALAVASAVALFAIAASMMGVRRAEAEPVPTTMAAPQPVEVELIRSGVAVVPPGGVELWSGPERDSFFTLHEGVMLPYLHRSGDWLLVTTMCNNTEWVDVGDVSIQEASTAAVVGTTFDLSQATVVVDAGHGDRDWGGVGPSGLSEKEVNLDIASRIRDLMLTENDVDWATGDISQGTTIAAFGSVIMSRDFGGPNDGDMEAGLGYRATLGQASGADAFVSIHNNTVPRQASDIPGSEVYYSTGADGSDRLAGLIYEELLRSLGAFEANWSGGEILGARSRIDPDTGDDYYGLLRRATMPAVIVEGVYISEPEEEALLATPEFRQAYADAVYRGVVRFLTSTEVGAEVNRPEVFHADAGTVSGNGCTLPEQP